MQLDKKSNSYVCPKCGSTKIECYVMHDVVDGKQVNYRTVQACTSCRYAEFET